MRALLLSGGLDSAALAFWFRPDVCVTVDYGQKSAAGELAAAESICSELSLPHRVVDVDLSALGSGQMSGCGSPKGVDAAAPEFWPYRNQMLVTLAGMLLQPDGLSEIIIGTVATDLHADGRRPFLRTLNRLMTLQEGNVAISAPASMMTSVTLLKRSGFPKRLVGVTFSCHLHHYACGQCRGCTKHRQVVERMYRRNDNQINRE
jgi:7-cyano-7-deazaguanine synthase